MKKKQCSGCRSYNVEEGITTEEWDFWHTEYKCNKCGKEWLVGDKKRPPTNPKTDPVREGNKLVVNTVS
jgi:transposase-like protein